MADSSSGDTAFKWIATTLASLVMAGALYQLNQLSDIIEGLRTRQGMLAERILTLEVNVVNHINREHKDKKVEGK